MQSNFDNIEINVLGKVLLQVVEILNFIVREVENDFFQILEFSY
jgi:hypothetical protein